MLPYDQDKHEEFLSVLNKDIKLSPSQINMLEKEEVFTLDNGTTDLIKD